MPKLKTHKATSKRTKVTGSGKITHRRAFGNHFLSKKSSARKRGYAKDYEITGKAEKTAKRLLGGK